MQCVQCLKSNLVMLFDGGVCKSCFEINKAKGIKPKMGRPVTKSRCQRRQKYKQWFIDNADHRRKYIRDYMRKQNGVVVGEFVVEHEGLYRTRKNKWGSFEEAKIYKSNGIAKRAIKVMGKGKLIKLKEGE